MRLKLKQLRTILALSILLVALLPSTVIGFVLLKQISEQEQRALAQTLDLQADSIAQNIQRKIQQLLFDLQSLAQVNDVVLTPQSSVFGFHSSQLLHQLLQQNDWAAATYIVNSAGQVIEAAPLQAEILDLQPQLPVLEMLKQQVSAGSTKPFIRLYRDTQFAQLVATETSLVSDAGLLLIQPITQKNQNNIEEHQLVGALMVFVPMQSVWHELQAHIAQQGSFELSFGQHSLLQVSKGALPKQLLNTEVVFHLANVPDALSLSLTAPSRSLWRLLVERQINVMLALVIILLVVVLIALLLMRRIVNPLKRLSTLVSQYSLGHYDSEVPQLAYEEFKQVGGLLKSMAARVTSDQALLEKRVFARTLELEKANKALQQTLEKLNNTQLELIEKQKMAALGGLVSGMAHELNTPLGVGITAVSQLNANYQSIQRCLANGTLAKSELAAMLCQGLEGAQLLESSLQRSAALVNSFKALAGSDIDVSLQQLRLKSCLEQQLRMLLQPYGDLAIQFSISGDDPEVELNQRALEVVISCLIDNSVQHGFPQQQHPHIRLQIESRQDVVVITYQDNGCGLKGGDISQIFNPFYTTGRSSGNVGLGLNQVYNLVNRHLNGSVECFEVVPQGLAFTICLAKHHQV